MLVELKVNNFAIIDSLDVHFTEGLNILSGETGAGKSVLIKSLALLMGEKALADTVRTGSQQATVEGCFEITDRPDIKSRLEEFGLEPMDDQLIVRRVISKQGRSRVYLNGALSALSNLRELVAPLISLLGHSAPLIELTGQHDNRNLQSRAYHLDLIDHYSGCWPIRREVSDLFDALQSTEEQIANLEEKGRQREQRLDFLKFQRDEIKSLQLEPGDEEQLETRTKQLKNTQRLREFAESAERLLYSDDDSVLVRLHQVIQNAQEVYRYDPQLEPRLKGLSEAKSIIEDLVYELRDYGRQIEAEPGELLQLENQLAQLRKLQRKYGESVAGILNQLETIESEIQNLEDYEERLKELESEKTKLHKQIIRKAEDLHQRRANGAMLLEKGVNEELQDLNMKGLGFLIKVEALEEAGPTGLTSLEFMIQASKKDEPRPLSKFASGGELSRILLSLKRVIGNSEEPRTYLFDEVDTGVSGETAEKVGRKLKSIAEGQQVICVTHLPQVARFADTHFLIEKSTTKGLIKMKLQALEDKDRIKEIARLISGEKITDSSLQHARQLLDL